MKKILLIIIFLIFLTTNKVFANINISFEIDENYLIAHTLNKKIGEREIEPYIIDFKDKVSKESYFGYRLIRSFSNIQPRDYRFFNPILKSLFTKAKKTIEYQRLLDETADFLQEMESEWITDYPETFNIVLKSTKLPLSGDYKLYVTHPSLGNGRYLGKNKIVFGTKARWQHYYSVYIWHEILHSFMKLDVISHSVNQIITDNGLRFILNSDNKKKNVGHPYLFPLMNEVQSKYWFDYLEDKSESILDFIERIKKDPYIEKLRKEANHKKY